tara:strand:- start:2847 stop:4151 length:1305 start_codon:yes stop_codon:yes gene_type:complete
MYKPIRIYCPNPTERHHYVFELVFNNLLCIDFLYTEDINFSHINYSTEDSKSLQITPNSLLNESFVRYDILNDIKFVQWQRTVIFFKNDNQKVPFDIFSAIFFLVTRYEEYLDFNPDDHGRFPATESILFKNSVLELPLVNQWVKLLRIELETSFNLKFPIQKFSYKSTIDIDQAWKYKNKGFIRNSLGAFRDIIKLNFSTLSERYAVLLKNKVDPYYNFQWQNFIHRQYNSDVTYFILVGNYSKYDKNISFKNSEFRTLICQLEEKNKVGIHPSYASNNNEDKLKNEFSKLNKVLSSKTSLSRQHYLIHSMPKTYQNLISIGIQEDHTMGYSTHLGFRAGIASPFLWFNLSKNKKTNLKLIPFCIMDITPMYYRKETPEQANRSIKNLIQSVRDIDGLFVSLWHNDSLSESERWKGWRIVYSTMLEELNKAIS